VDELEAPAENVSFRLPPEVGARRLATS
jgi:hypothetical protein